jgi:type I restriction enzyme S subunit
LGVSHYHGIISSAYGVYRLREDYAEYADYIHELVRSSPFQWELQVRSKGVWTSRLQLTDDAFLDAPFPVPPPTDKDAIVRFLKYINRRISFYIRGKRQLIKLLEEQNQGVIHRAVTRGLNPNVGLKPSGIEWLGDVPEHWKIIRLGRLISLITGFPFKSEGFTQSADDIRLLRGINISPGQVRWNDVVRWPVSDRSNFRKYELVLGDIVLGMDRPIIQGGIRVAAIGASDVPALLLQRVARIRPHHEILPEFTVLLLSGKSFKDYLSPIFTGVSVPHLSPEQIKSFQLALPPLEEQRQIVHYLLQEASAISAAIERTNREISLLREYRTRLIADVVTGKLDVREVAASLPDEVEMPDDLLPADEVLESTDDAGLLSDELAEERTTA